VQIAITSRSFAIDTFLGFDKDDPSWTADIVNNASLSTNYAPTLRTASSRQNSLSIRIGPVLRKEAFIVVVTLSLESQRF